MTIQEYDDDIEALPANLVYYGASDYATMEPRKGKKEPDYSEHGVVGFDHIGDLWFVDWWSGQVETDKSIRAWGDLLVKYKARKTPLVKWWDEGGPIDKAIGPAIRREMRDRRTYVTRETMSSIMDKGMKLQAFHARVTAGTVHFPKKRKWADQVIEQLIKFPTGRFDDKADVCGLIGRGMDQMNDARIPPDEHKPLLVPFTSKWIEYNDGANKPKVRYF